MHKIIIDSGALPLLSALLDSKAPKIVREVCWILSNIASGSEEQAYFVLDNELVFERLLPLLGKDSPDEVKQLHDAL